MKIVPLIGAALLLLGVLSFVVPVPHDESHGIKVGDTKIGVQTERSEKIPTVASVVLIGAGVVALVLGSRRA